LEAGAPFRHLGLTKKPAVKFIALAIFAILVSQFFLDFLVSINQAIPLPENLKFIKDSSKKMEQVTNALLSGTSIIQFIANVVVVAFIPAIAEEFFFRGLLLGDLLKGKVHPAIAIIVTGFIFAIGHAYYENTLAIWALGSFLGYLYYVSGSLWLPIAAHFANNFLGVLLKYLVNLGVIGNEMANAKTPLYVTFISLAIFGACIFLFYKWKNPATFVELPKPNTQ
jgi:membrane protease YdiL (CAAX protease family)